MYKKALKILEKQYDDLIIIQYRIINHENYVEKNPKEKHAEYSLNRIEELRTREKNQIKSIKKHIKILEKIADDLEV